MDYLDDIESDLSVLHRIDDLESLSAARFVRLTERLWYYPGAMQARVAAQQARLAPQPELPAAVPASAPPAGVEVVEATREALSGHGAFADLVEWG